VKVESRPSARGEIPTFRQAPPPAFSRAPNPVQRSTIKPLLAPNGFARKPQNLIIHHDDHLAETKQVRHPATSRRTRKLDLAHSWIIALIGLYTALGLMLVEVADQTSVRSGNYNDAVILFFAGLIAIFAPVAVRVLSRDVVRQERFALIILLGLALYAVKIIGSPTSFTFIDEYIHLRNTQNILDTHHLFGLNPLLPTAAYYPGLGAVCAGLIDLTGLSPFVSGLIVIGASRLLITACLFFIAERATKSSVAAAGASLMYAANPMFLFWSSSFSYEDLALPLAAFVVWWIARTRGETARLVSPITLIAIAAVTVTHHIAAFALTVVLGAWWLAEFLFRRPDTRRREVGRMALVIGLASSAWFFIVARPATSYLFGENILPALQQMGAVVSGHAKPRHLYSGGGAPASPEWYMMAGFAAVALIVLALPPALYRAWSIAFQRQGANLYRNRGLNIALIIAMVIAAAFPVSQLPRLTTEGGAISSRSSEYLFTGLGCVLGLLAEKAIRSRRAKLKRMNFPAMPWLRTLVAASAVTVVLIGEASIASSYTELLPEASNPPGYPWMVQPDVIRASEWARVHLGINQHFAVGIVDSQALATYGEQDTLTESSWPIFLNTAMNDTVVNTIRTIKVRYLFVDWRMTNGIPTNPGDYYFSPWEPLSGKYTRPMPAVMLRKFTTTDCSRLIYTSGPIQIFDVTRIENGSCIPSAARTAHNAQGAP
jgi:hypothetical protein